MAIQNKALEIRKRPFANGNAVELSDTAGNPVRPNEASLSEIEIDPLPSCKTQKLAESTTILTPRTSY